MFKHFRHIACLLIVFTSTTFANADYIYLRPKYAADTVSHRNKMDQNGQKWGIWNYYSQEGLLILSIEFKANVRDGVYIRYNEVNGKMIEKGHYKKGVKTGPFSKWYSNGEKRVEGHYQNGQKSGHWAYYYKGGKGAMRMSGQFVAGRKEGIWVFYDKSGSIRKEVIYEAGLIKMDPPKQN